eukprot:TRINITY_DN7039_c0_g1_i1.p1 TRINITY_DN7039_c0_g1~~TRINITY_DN7039_c0_g1_i1.p1  ORF type:complete len:430 (-),score=70.85 TRINITY_DN7039_c0_g1_i1:512-1801(-)
MEKYVNLYYPKMNATKKFYKAEKLSRNTHISVKKFHFTLTSSEISFCRINVYDENKTCIFQNLFQIRVKPNIFEEKSEIILKSNKFVAGEEVIGRILVSDNFGNKIKWDSVRHSKQELWVENFLKETETLDLSLDGRFLFSITRSGNYQVNGPNIHHPIPITVNAGEMCLQKSSFSISPKKEIYKGGTTIIITVNPYDNFKNNCDTFGADLIFNGKRYIFQNNKAIIILENEIQGRHSITVSISNHMLKLFEIDTVISSPDLKNSSLILKTPSINHVGNPSIFHLILKDEEKRDWDPISSVMTLETFFNESIEIKIYHNSKKRYSYDKKRLSPGLWQITNKDKMDGEIKIVVYINQIQMHEPIVVKLISEDPCPEKTTIILKNNSNARINEPQVIEVSPFDKFGNVNLNSHSLSMHIKDGTKERKLYVP